MTNSKIAIIDKSRTLTEYKNAALHELGHSLGWFEHSSTSTDVMYPYASTVITLTSRDIQQLIQVY